MASGFEGIAALGFKGLQAFVSKVYRVYKTWSCLWVQGLGLGLQGTRSEGLGTSRLLSDCISTLWTLESWLRVTDL